MHTRLGQKCLAFLRDYKGPPPSYAEIALGIGTSKQQAAKTVRRLIRDRLLERSGAPMKRTHGVCGLRIRVSHQASPLL